MNGIEQIRKANELSRVLKNHGLAQDSFDAIKKAHSIANKEKSIVLEVDPTSLKQETPQQNDALKNRLISLERSKHMLNQRVDDYSQLIKQLQEENKQLKSRLEVVESKIKFFSRDSGAASSATNPPVTEAPVPSQSTITPQNNTRSNTAAQLSATPTRSSSANAPGNRGVDPASVSIENIFYYGQK